MDCKTAMSTNIFNRLEDNVLEKTTNDVVRKAKKKLREIEILKTKAFLSDEEMEKVKKEKYWKIFIPSSQKFFESNHFNIKHSFQQCSVESEDCPICLNPIRKNMGIVTNCRHSYCCGCLSSLIKKSKTIKCSLCRGEITNFDFRDQDNMFEIMKILSM
jgi:hypothetical protein